jgi:flagellar M-ring protein FliF
MRLREQGLLGTADFNFDIMEGATGFGITDNHARQLYDAQMGEHIRTQLIQSARIQNALVIVNSGESSPFRIQSNARQATASVMLTLSGGGRLSQAEAQSIGELVRNAIPGIEFENITIIDNEFNLYNIGDDNQDLETEIDHRLALQLRLTANMQENVETLLAPIFGPNNIQIQPYVRLNFDRVAVEEVEFAPPIAGEMDGIIRSSEEVHELSRRWADAEGIPGTDSNNMGAPEYPWGPLDENDFYRRAVIGRNYEINETRTMIERERGVVEELSIAVLINSEIEGVDQDFTDEVTDLVAKAIGVAPANISVQLVPFAYEDTTLADMYAQWEEQEAARRNRELFETILMYTVILLLGVMVVLLVRSIIKAVQPPPEPEPLFAAAGPDAIDFLVDDEPEELEFEDVDLTSKSAGLEQIERFIDKDSASVAQLLRNWLSDD